MDREFKRKWEESPECGEKRLNKESSKDESLEMKEKLLERRRMLYRKNKLEKMMEKKRKDLEKTRTEETETKEKESKDDKKKMMEEILRSHYEEQATIETASDPTQKDPENNFECDQCDFSSGTSTGLKRHIIKLHQTKSDLKDFFHFPNFLGFSCSLLGSHFIREIYYVTEVSQPKKSEYISLPDNLSETCYFFIPESIFLQYPDIKTWVNVKIPYYHSKRNGFGAHFPKSIHPVTWAVNLAEGQKCVEKKEMFIFSKSRFKLIQSTRSAQDQKNQSQYSAYKRAYGSYGSFCQFLDEDQAQIENLIRIKTEAMMEDTVAEESNHIQIELGFFTCPFETCNFISDKKFSGIRNHLLKHFKEKIEEGAKPRAMLSEREKSNCMSKTGCSVPTLLARGELVHHFGIFHCLVDDYFQDFAFSWLHKTYNSHFTSCLCPYEDHTYKDDPSFLEHLTVSHYFNSILAEIEDMVRFTPFYSEEKKSLTNVYKCPFCKLKFSNLADGSKARDVKEMVIHCGMEHGFALYYLMSDKNIEDMRELLVKQNIKTEPMDEAYSPNASVQSETCKIKVEPLEETEADINNFVKAELDDYIKVKEEPEEP